MSKSNKTKRTVKAARKQRAITVLQMIKVVEEHGACIAATKWLKRRAKLGDTAAEVWEKCKNSGWLLFAVERVGGYESAYERIEQDPFYKKADIACGATLDVAGRVSGADYTKAMECYNFLRDQRERETQRVVKELYPWEKMEPHFRDDLERVRRGEGMF